MKLLASTRFRSESLDRGESDDLYWTSCLLPEVKRAFEFSIRDALYVVDEDAKNLTNLRDRFGLVTAQGPTWSPDGRAQVEQVSEGGTSSAGLRSKNPAGNNEKPQYSTGITGQSSGRGIWVNPKVCQTTRSVFSSERLFSM